MDIFILARNTGTSSEMIHRFYADVKLELELELMKDHLWREWKLLAIV